MRFLAVILLLITTSVWSLPASAAQVTVKDLSDMCSSSDQASQRGCDLYILGSIEGLSLSGNTELRNGQFTQKVIGRQFCVPDDLPNAIMRDKVLALVETDLKAWPDDAKMPAISWIAGVVTKTWPCR